MATYIYETIPQDESEPVRFEVEQSMKDAALMHHPETGMPVRRIITGGYLSLGSSRWRNRRVEVSGPACSHSGSSPCCE